MKFLWNISCLIVCLIVICLYCDSIKADQDGKFGVNETIEINHFNRSRLILLNSLQERPQLVEKTLGTWIDLLRQELHKENRRDE